MDNKKPILSIDAQIQHLKEKGVKYEITDEDTAKDYLKRNNNYFKLTSYRKNYAKHPDGDNKGSYIDLDFAYLIDTAVIDMHLRYLIVQMALDIEHHVKLQLMNKIEDHGEDGYQIVQDFIDSLDNRQKIIYESEINRNKGNIYCGDIIKKYDGAYPVWAYIEVVPFGRLISFYGFCADRFTDKSMKENFYRLLTCREIRNASAHSNCILNDLKAKTSRHTTNSDVTKSLLSIKNLSSNFRKNRMSNARIQQIVTLLYTYKEIVVSDGLKINASEGLSKVLGRAYKNFDYYKNNPMIKGTFDFLKIVVDSWFINE